jgi:hypothetical protein
MSLQGRIARYLCPRRSAYCWCSMDRTLRPWGTVPSRVTVAWVTPRMHFLKPLHVHGHWHTVIPTAVK